MQPLTAVVSLQAMSGTGNLVSGLGNLVSGSGNAATDSCRVPANGVRLR